MASITLTIPLPILVTGQHFKTRYRSLPSGIWSGYTNRTNAAFTLTGLSAGNYELEVIVVDGDTECPATTKTFTVVPEFTCIDFTATMASEGVSIFYLQVQYTPPMTNPPCGWLVIYTINNVTNTVPYTTLPSSGILNITLPSNSAVHLKMRANLCDGKYKDCFDGDISPINPPCTPMKLVSAELKYNSPSSSSPNTYFIRLTIQNSNPTTPNYQVNYQETSYTNPLPPDQGSFVYSGATLTPGGQVFLYSFQVHPNSQFKNNVNGGEVFYQGSIVDICGVSHPFSCQLP